MEPEEIAADLPGQDAIDLADELAKRGFCWSLGRTRHTMFEFRIWPRSQKFRKPVIIASGSDFMQAVKVGLAKLGSGMPCK